MKPYHLKISAFGPFAKTVDLNFKDDLNDARIFVITGPTGAGKTTIFDAICYALYGESSGATRKGAELRSDFSASLDILTSVELTFGIRDHVYTIKRTPKQQAPKKRGTGYKEVPASVELLKLDDIRPPLTKESDVKQEINALLGLTVDQFRKIVMIPQGDFKEFLMAGTMAKEELLRKIFGTALYKNLQEKLSDAANKIKEKVAGNLQEMQAAVKTLPEELLEKIEGDHFSSTKTMEALQHQITMQSKKQAQASHELEAAKKAYTACQNEYNAAKSTHEMFQTQRQLQLEFERLQTQEEDMAALKQEIARIRQASTVQVLEANKSRLEKNFANVEKSEREKQEQLDVKTQEIVLLKNDYEKLSEKEAEVKSLVEKESALEGFLKELRLLAPLKKKLKEEVAKQQQFEKKRLELGQKIEFAKIETSALESERMERLQQENILHALELQEAAAFAEIDMIKKLLKSYRKWEQTAAQLEALQLDFEKQQFQTSNMKEIYEQRASEYIYATAARLAQELKVGQECPVCGSCQHPKPAISATTVLTKEELEQYKAIYEAAEASEKELLAKLSACQREESSLKGEFTKNSEIELFEKLHQSEVSYKKIVDSIAAAKQKKLQLEHKIAKLEKTQNSLKQWEEDEASLKQQLFQLEINIKSTQKSEETASLRIPTEYRNIFTLEENIKNVVKIRKGLEDLIIKRRQQYEQLHAQVRELKAALATLSHQKNIIQNDYSQAINEFEGERAKHFSTLENYQQAINKVKELSKLETAFYNFSNRKYSVEQRLEELNSKLKDQPAQDLDPIKEKLERLEAEKESFSAMMMELDQQLKQVHHILDFIQQRHEKIKSQEEEFRTIGELAELANGRTAGKMTFETYILSSYFDSVLAAANIRLEKMTAGRYYLLRREEIKGGGRKGLELDIYDSYTCKKRPINTLSGGESFKASLALALGLSDTVQRNAGGILLNTMFIDEGFGTLDPHSLEQAVDILMDLQHHGRLIGVISHVAELKDRIPAKLIVKAGADGSQAAFEC